MPGLNAAGSGTRRPDSANARAGLRFLSGSVAVSATRQFSFIFIFIGKRLAQAKEGDPRINTREYIRSTGGRAAAN
jgi:hypothetical protein